MLCPNCKEELTKINEGKETDGTEFIEYLCKSCNEKYADLKIPHTAFLNQFPIAE